MRYRTLGLTPLLMKTRLAHTCLFNIITITLKYEGNVIILFNHKSAHKQKSLNNRIITIKSV